MREYLFRGKRVDNGEWVEGYLTYNHTRKQYYIMDDVNAFPIPVHEESVGQYTGMKDKNSRRIFEGDIVRLDKDVKDMFDICDGIVKYGWGGFYIGGFSTLNSLNVISTFDGVVRGEVIGTEFENADLLEG